MQFLTCIFILPLYTNHGFAYFIAISGLQYDLGREGSFEKHPNMFKAAKGFEETIAEKEKLLN